MDNGYAYIIYICIMGHQRERDLRQETLVVYSVILKLLIKITTAVGKIRNKVQH